MPVHTLFMRGNENNLKIELYLRSVKVVTWVYGGPFFRLFNREAAPT